MTQALNMEPDSGNNFDKRVELRSIHHADKPMIDLPISLVRIDDLHPHEMVIEDEYRGLINRLKEDGYVKTPILISEDHVILDGHHRYSALKALGVKRIPAIVLDYGDDNLIKVDTWHPIVQCPIDTVLTELKFLGLAVESISGDYRELLNNRSVSAVVGNKERMYKVVGRSISEGKNLIYGHIRDKWLDGIQYADVPELAFSVTSEKVTAIISWSYTKDEIRQMAKSMKVFLPKTTRHYMDFQFPDSRTELEKLF